MSSHPIAPHRQKRSLELSYSPPSPVAPSPAAQAAKKPKKYLVVQTPKFVFDVPMSDPSVPRVIALLNYVTSLDDDGAEQRLLGGALEHLVVPDYICECDEPALFDYICFLEPYFINASSAWDFRRASTSHTLTQQCAICIQDLQHVAQMHRLYYEPATVDNDDDDATTE